LVLRVGEQRCDLLRDAAVLEQFGVGLAVAILIDATIIRGVLLPATMKLLGEWNWYLPRWLEWLPGTTGPEQPLAPAAPAPTLTPSDR
jgi:putative drug exporter of the RND superfamily